MNAGSAYVFVPVVGGTWAQEAKLVASDAASFEEFGISVGLAGDVALIGADGDYSPPNPAAGAAYVFTRTGGAWTQQAKLSASDGSANDYLGISVAISGDTAVAGAWYDYHAAGIQAGSAYVFSLAGCVPVSGVAGLSQPCPGDVDSSGSVTGIDLAQLLGQWTGAATYAPCLPSDAQDLNGDCKINGVDLALLLGAWGPCQ
jgi:hypothetical protein